MQDLYCACVVALLSPTAEKALQMWHLELLEMKAEVVFVALLTLLNIARCLFTTPKMVRYPSPLGA